MKFLLIGADGQLGQELRHSLAPLGEIFPLTRRELDLSEPEKLVEVIYALEPNAIINAAAYTAVDKAESEPELAQLINAIAPQIMAETAKKVGAWFLQVSTDYVFDGSKNTPYLETDQTNPLSVYGQTKLAGERNIEQVGGDFLILRTAWVYGLHGKGNFMKTMLRLGQSHEELGIVIDQVGTPTAAQEIATAIADLYQAEATGTYHFTNSGVCSWYDFAVAIFEEAEALGIPLKVKEVKPIATIDYPTPATRPAYSVLSVKKFAETVGHYPLHWRKSLHQMLASVQN